MVLCSAGAQCDLEIVLLGNHVQVNNEQRASAAITEDVVSHLKIQILYCVFTRLNETSGFMWVSPSLETMPSPSSSTRMLSTCNNYVWVFFGGKTPTRNYCLYRACTYWRREKAWFKARSPLELLTRQSSNNCVRWCMEQITVYAGVWNKLLPNFKSYTKSCVY